MKYRRLGNAGIRVSEVSLGSWLTYGCGVDDDAARACIRQAYELGINFFDTADVYHRGAAETVLGRELKDYPRRDLVIATKCYFPMSDGVNDRGLSRKHIRESIDDSLQRLQVDYVDLLQCHRHDPDVDLAELVRTMDDLVRQGKILYWGLSEWPAKAIHDVDELAAAMNAVAPVSEQPEYSIAARRVETNGVQTACAEAGLGMVVWSPLKQGLLTGKYTGGKVPEDSRAASPEMNVFLQRINAQIVENVEQLRPIADRHGVTLAQLALAWLLRQESVASVIVGASRPAQVVENCAAVDVTLTDDDLARIDALFPPAEFQ
jgi:voltage-dependent potassium channel beta subunit